VVPTWGGRGGGSIMLWLVGEDPILSLGGSSYHSMTGEEGPPHCMTGGEGSHLMTGGEGITSQYDWGRGDHIIV